MSALFIAALRTALDAHEYSVLGSCECGFRPTKGWREADRREWADHRALVIQQAVYDYLSEERLARAICAARKPVLADADDPDLFVDDECKHIALFTRTAFLT